MSYPAKRNSSVCSSSSDFKEIFQANLNKPIRRYSTASRRVSVFSLEHLHCEVTDKVVNKFKQFTICLMASFGVFSYGFNWTMSSVIGPQLIINGEKASLDQVSWISTIFVLGSTTGSFIGGVNAEKFGRKKAMLFDGTCILVGMIMIGFFDSFPILLAGRYICGSASSSLQSIIPAYTSEISQPAFRSVTAVPYMCWFTGGLTIMLVMGAVMPWALAVKVMSACPLIFIFGVMVICPESPIWLITQGRRDEATAVLKSLRGDELMVKIEVDRIKRSYEEVMADQSGSSAKMYLSLFKDKAFLRPFLTLVLTFCIFAEWSGLPAIAFYTVQLLTDIRVPIDPYVAAAAVMVVRFVALVLGNLVIANLRMRPVFFSTATTHIILLSTIASYSYANKDGSLVESYPWAQWTPIVCILMIYMTSAAGCFNVMFNFTGILLPSYARTFGAGLVGALDNLALVLVAKVFPTMLAAFDLHGTFAIFAVCVAVSTVILWFTLPETYGLTLEDIEQFYRAEKGQERKAEVD